MIASSFASLAEDLRILQRVASAIDTLPDDAVARRTLSPGSRWGRLTIRGRLARGSYGMVYRAFDTQTGCDVALKILHDPLSSLTPESRLLAEARAMARVRHPGVVRLHGFAIHRRRAGLWMEFIHGGTLEDWIRDHGPAAVGDAVRVGADLCDALAAVHDAGLVHGDVKPQNVMRTSDGRVVLIDLGSATGIAQGARPQRRLTGTPLYLAPEVLADRRVSVASDIYSLGVLLFHLVSREYPVQGDSLGAIADAHRRGAVRRVQDLRPDVPQAVCHAVDRALSPDPRLRYACARELQAELAPFRCRVRS